MDEIELQRLQKIISGFVINDITHQKIISVENLSELFSDVSDQLSMRFTFSFIAKKIHNEFKDEEIPNDIKVEFRVKDSKISDIIISGPDEKIHKIINK